MSEATLTGLQSPTFGIEDAICQTQGTSALMTLAAVLPSRHPKADVLRLALKAWRDCVVARVGEHSTRVQLTIRHGLVLVAYEGHLSRGGTP